LWAAVPAHKQQFHPVIPQREVNKLLAVESDGPHRDVEKFLAWLIEIAQAERRSKIRRTKF
jgi:hypothetical protein